MSPRDDISCGNELTSTAEPVVETSAERDLTAASGLLALSVVSVDVESRRVVLRRAKSMIAAKLDSAVHPSVVQTALDRGERLIVQQEEGEYVVLGALRTAPTPGVERGDDYVIEARRIRLSGDHEVVVIAGGSSVVLRALGHLELLSKNITARAEGVQKLFARMIQLN